MEFNIIKMGPKQIFDFNKPNQPFLIIGKIIPKYDGEKWEFSEVHFSRTYEKRYPNDEIDIYGYIDNTKKAIFMCYCNDGCIGQIRLRNNWNRYCFIEDIAVSNFYRGKGIGTALLHKAETWAKENNLYGFMLETQDINLFACRFYKKYGFQIGSVDTMLYSNFENNQEKAIFWYMKFERPIKE